eukprot:4404297-Amphidinium_carterae.1
MLQGEWWVPGRSTRLEAQSHVALLCRSYFCREYWGTSASKAQLSLEKLNFTERLKRQVLQLQQRQSHRFHILLHGLQVQLTCVLESLSLAVAAHLCSGCARCAARIQ